MGVTTTGSNCSKMSVSFGQGTPLHTSGNPVRRASYVTGSHPPQGVQTVTRGRLGDPLLGYP